MIIIYFIVMVFFFFESVPVQEPAFHPASHLCLRLMLFPQNPLLSDHFLITFNFTLMDYTGKTISVQQISV